MRSLTLVPNEAGEIWVFGYGSLMWNPGFPHGERAEAILNGYRRRLCVFSENHRGTPEKPGLVMGLDAGGSCRGAAYRIDPQDSQKIAAYLAERELIYAVYQAHVVPVTLKTGSGRGKRIQVNTFVCDRRHPHYAGNLTQSAAAQIVATAVGDRGSSLDYLEKATRSLREAGTPSLVLEALLAEAHLI